jgi:hypothetical protein
LAGIPRFPLLGLALLTSLALSHLKGRALIGCHF